MSAVWGGPRGYNTYSIHQYLASKTHNQVDSTGKETGLSCAQQQSCDHQSCKVLNKPGTGHNQAPRNDEDTEVGAGSSKSLENYVGRDLKKYVWNEEDAESNIILFEISLSSGE